MWNAMSFYFRNKKQFWKAIKHLNKQRSTIPTLSYQNATAESEANLICWTEHLSWDPIRPISESRDMIRKRTSSVVQRSSYNVLFLCEDHHLQVRGGMSLLKLFEKYSSLHACSIAPSFTKRFINCFQVTPLSEDIFCCSNSQICKPHAQCEATY